MIGSCGSKEDLKKMIAKYLYSNAGNFILKDDGSILQYRRDSERWKLAGFKWSKKKTRYYFE